jgi:hypothetical protein
METSANMARKAAFLSPLDVRKEARGRWRLLAPLAYRSALAGHLFEVPEGFVTDFASVPRLPVVYLVAGDTAHEAAVIHDWLYTTHQVGRVVADQVFSEAIQASGQGAALASIMYTAVRLGGRASWDAPGPEQPPHVAELIAQ